jgi:hypothetical protein
MTPEQKFLMMSKRGMNSYNANGAGADVMPIVSNNQLVTLHGGPLNPNFIAQIQMNLLKQYYSVAAGVYTSILPAAVPAALQTALPVFIFGTSDFASGFAKIKSQYQSGFGSWTMNRPVVYNKDYAADNFSAWTATVTNNLRDGDLVVPFTATNAGTNYVALAIVRTTDVAYATLLDALNSNKFNTNLVRYSVTAGQETQFANGITIADLSMFGKFVSDPINPEAFISPLQDQDNRLDMDADMNISKTKSLSLLANYDVVTFRFNIFIYSVDKI